MRLASTIIMASIIMISLNTASALNDEVSNLKDIISSNEDEWMNSRDLAFFLATHNINAVPKDGYVEVPLSGMTCKLVPNGEKPGLCDMVH